MNSVGALLRSPFSTLSYDDKLQVKQLGRPLPKLNIVYKQQSAKVDRWRKFNSEVYTKNKWLCGCDEKHAFFCFPCILFGGDSSWSKDGVTDLVHLSDRLKKHERSNEHMNNVMSLSMLGRINIQTQLGSHYQQSMAKHNEQVSKNRYVLNLIINCIRFCGAFELVLRGHNESEESENKGIFRELINFSSELDKDLKEHFNKSPAFTGTSKTIQNDLLECMLQVYHDEVKKEINSVTYAAVIADDTTDISCQFQLVMLIRYIIDGKPVERFWKFLNLECYDACAISNCILMELEPLIGSNPNKLIAQSYDGASVMSGGLNGVEKLIKDKYQYANFIHCYAHKVNLIISKAASINRQARIFFSNMTGICAFFSNSSQRIAILDAVVQRQLPRASQTRWDFQSHGVNIVYNYRRDLISVMEIIENRVDITLETTITQASSYKLLLNDENFVFWLEFFHKIVPYVQIIYNQLEEKYIDPVKVREHMHNFELSMQSVKEEVGFLFEGVKTELEKGNEEPLVKRERTEATYAGNDKNRQALEVCDAIFMQIKSRFDFTEHLVAARLFAVEEFGNYKRRFPTSCLSEIVRKYPFLEEGKLKSELQVCYARPELRIVSGAISFLMLIIDDELCDTFQETVKLLKLLITMPMSTSEAERRFSKMKIIKTFLRHTMIEERLTALGMLSCEKAFVKEIDNFNKKVIDTFASKKEWHIDFNYHTF